MQTAISCIFKSLKQKNKSHISAIILFILNFMSSVAIFSLCKLTQINGYNFVTVVTVLFLLHIYSYFSEFQLSILKKASINSGFFKFKIPIIQKLMNIISVFSFAFSGGL